MDSKSPNNTHDNIQKWYKTHGRLELPWRTTDDPYHIYLSEVMLQQTQVKTVLEHYYFPFLKKFPTLKALGDAPLDDVLKMWEGLGCYNRAKNLHKMAILINGYYWTLSAEGGNKGQHPNALRLAATSTDIRHMAIATGNAVRCIKR